MNNPQPLTVYINVRKGIENEVMHDLIEVFSGTILMSSTPNKVLAVIEKRGYTVVERPILKND